jgi:phosphate acyltransferase
MQALKRKKDASMVRAVELVKNGEAGVVVSSGNTGALMAGATLRLRMMDGVDRPALCAVVPRDKGFFVLIDAGANPESGPENLVHNAILGANYARVIFGLPAPRVGLLTIGTEEGKGGKLITETHERLSRINGVINYVGLIEGFQVFKDDTDVVVCDGFVGNTLLKTWESLAKFITGLLKEELKQSPVRMAGAALAKGAFDTLKARMNPDRYGGAPLLGVRGNVLKAQQPPRLGQRHPRRRKDPPAGHVSPRRARCRPGGRPPQPPRRARGEITYGLRHHRRSRHLFARARRHERRTRQNHGHVRRVDPHAHRHPAAPHRRRG